MSEGDVPDFIGEQIDPGLFCRLTARPLSTSFLLSEQTLKGLSCAWLKGRVIPQEASAQSFGSFNLPSCGAFVAAQETHLCRRFVLDFLANTTDRSIGGCARLLGLVLTSESSDIRKRQSFLFLRRT